MLIELTPSPIKTRRQYVKSLEDYLEITTSKPDIYYKAKLNPGKRFADDIVIPSVGHWF